MGFELRPGLDFKAQDTRTRAWTIFFLRKSTKQRNGMLQTRAESLSSNWAQNCAPLETVPLNAFPVTSFTMEGIRVGESVRVLWTCVSLRWQAFHLMLAWTGQAIEGSRHGHQTPGPLTSGLQTYEKHRLNRKVQLDIPKIKNGSRGWISVHGLTIQFQR